MSAMDSFFKEMLSDDSYLDDCYECGGIGPGGCTCEIDALDNCSFCGDEYCYGECEDDD